MDYLFKNQVFIGAFISILSATITSLVHFKISEYQLNKGNVNIYIMSVYDSVSGEPWGFYGNQEEIVFNVPLWVEIHNTKGKSQIIRNMNLALYNKNSFIGKTHQISHFSKGEKMESYGEDGAYSFLIESNSIKRFELCFTITQSELYNLEFDEVRISYWDSKDDYKEYKIFEVSEPWQFSSFSIDNDWRKLG
ncbi:hypothetical protein [Streptococcus sp. HMSC078H12]|uniref:hypothetical protein n=1 Tax=Streptococcus sp. HMSC078H12 TaxID=1739483 RepID=UPI0008A5D1A0|nr:hypothetical protein [Streptococcus sp. HMSC078H12]